MEAAAAQRPAAPPGARPAAVLAGGGGAAAIGSPADAGLLLDDVDIAEQRRILQDIAVRQQDNALELLAVACSIVSASRVCHASRMELDTIDGCEGTA
jgi:hypothetical protein